MEFIKSVKGIFTKVLSVGKPSDDDVLYSEVIKRKVPEESAEKLAFMEIKEKVTHIFHTKNSASEQVSEFSRGTPTQTPVKATPSKKETVQKKKTATKTSSKNTTKKTKSTTEKKVTKTAAKKPAVQKTTDTKTVEKKPPLKKSTTKKSDTKKTDTQKTSPKKQASKKTNETKSATAKKSASPKGSKRAEKIALYIKDIKKHYGEVDEDFVTIIVKNLGPSIYKKDAELVSCSDPKELNTVRKNFLMKKLGIDASQGVLDAAIEDVCQELKSTRTKYRATFYYALAKKFKKESVLS